MPIQRVFTIASANYTNIGDALIYRKALSWTADVQSRHVFVGRAPNLWLEQIELERGRDTVYGASVGDVRGRLRSITTWAFRLAFGRGSTALVFDVGEVWLQRRRLPYELLNLVLAVIVRLRGGVVIRPPHAVHANYSKATLAVFRLGERLTNLSYFRTRQSRELVGRGVAVPDIGFSEERRSGLPVDRRDLLLVSLRGDRPDVDETWVAGVRLFAERKGWRIAAVTQVVEDEQRSHSLAERLGGAVVPWLGEDRIRMERELIDVYGRAAFVVSDRLHVLVYGLLCGAVGAEVVPTPSPKVAVHLATAGIDAVTIDATAHGAEQIAAFLESVHARREEILAAVPKAGSRLAAAEREVRDLLTR
ncbi:hypothetical protein ACH0AH_08915 [Microbacterium paludicola]|uniref:hypothetical protein n=1 Tax=Microbacterium paludicola TaxID=300019 RepID=UPI00387A2D33